MSKGDDIRRRRQAVSVIVRKPREFPVTVTQLLAELGTDVRKDIRTLQRDLQSLKEGGFVARSGNGWIARDKSFEEDLDSLSTSVALQVFLQALDWAVPQEVQRDLRGVLSSAEQRIARSYPQHPTNRWLHAFRFQSPYANRLQRPVINADVRDAVEAAILYRKRLRINYKYVVDQVTEISVSHYLLWVPDEVSIVVWTDHNTQQGHPFVLPLKDVYDAEVLDTQASWPEDFDLDKFLEHQETWSTSVNYVVKISPSKYIDWNTRQIGRQLEVMEVDVDGFVTCRFAGGHPLRMIGWFRGRDGIEVIEPADVRRYLLLDPDQRSAVTWHRSGCVASWDDKNGDVLFSKTDF